MINDPRFFVLRIVCRACVHSRSGGQFIFLLELGNDFLAMHAAKPLQGSSATSIATAPGSASLTGRFLPAADVDSHQL